VVKNTHAVNTDQINNDSLNTPLSNSSNGEEGVLRVPLNSDTNWATDSNVISKYACNSLDDTNHSSVDEKSAVGIFKPKSGAGKKTRHKRHVSSEINETMYKNRARGEYIVTIKCKGHTTREEIIDTRSWDIVRLIQNHYRLKLGSPVLLTEIDTHLRSHFATLPKAGVLRALLTQLFDYSDENVNFCPVHHRKYSSKYVNHEVPCSPNLGCKRNKLWMIRNIERIPLNEIATATVGLPQNQHQHQDEIIVLDLSDDVNFLPHLPHDVTVGLPKNQHQNQHQHQDEMHQDEIIVPEDEIIVPNLPNDVNFLPDLPDDSETSEIADILGDLWTNRPPLVDVSELPIVPNPDQLDAQLSIIAYQRERATHDNERERLDQAGAEVTQTLEYIQDSPSAQQPCVDEQYFDSFLKF